MNFRKLFIYLICFVFFSTAEAVKPPKLLIKIPTRDRFDQFFATLDEFYSKLSKEIPYHFVISCDNDDPVMNSSEAIEKLNSYPNLSYYFSDNASKIEACNKDIDLHIKKFNILILASDDMVPLVENFDLIVAEAMQSHFPKYNGVLHFNDGLQGSNLITLPIMGNKFYKKFGYVYYPGYKSLYCDTEMTDVARMLNKVVYFDQVIIEHRHPGAGKAENDDLYIRNDAYFDVDRDLYNERRLINFGLDPKKIVNPLF